MGLAFQTTFMRGKKISQPFLHRGFPSTRIESRQARDLRSILFQVQPCENTASDPTKIGGQACSAFSVFSYLELE